MATHTAQFRITVDTFRTIGSLMTSSITMKPEGNLPPPVTQIGSYSMSIKKPANGETNHMFLKFLLDQERYLLLGAAFSAKDFSQATATGKCGQEDFSDIDIDSVDIVSGGVVIRRDRVMTIKNNRTHRGMANHGSFDYLLLIQQVSDGQIGMIDPEIINEE